MSKDTKKISLGIAIISAIQLGSELLFIKLSRYEFGTLSLGVLGLAMLGVAFASPMTKLLGGAQKATSRALLLLPLSILFAGWYLFSLPHQITDINSLYQRIFISGSLCLISLSLASVPTFAEIVNFKGSVYRLYAASLIGATLGVPITFAGMHFFGDIFAGVLQLILCLIAALVLIPKDNKWRSFCIIGSLFITIIAFNLFTRADKLAHPNSYFIKSNAFSRIDAIKKQKNAFQFRTAGINGGTSSVPGPISKPHKDLIDHLSALPFRVQPKTALILGSGAGKNVLQGLHFGLSKITAVEINEMIPDFMSKNLQDESNPYKDPRVNLVVAEGREFAAQMNESGEKFDLIYVPVATLFGSSGHALTQTYLMSTEAISLYFNMLNESGYVAIYFRSVIADKLIYSIAQALKKLDIKNVNDHIIAFDQGSGFVLLARPYKTIDAITHEQLTKAPPNKKLYNVQQSLERATKLRFLSDDNPFLYNDGTLLDDLRSLFGYNVEFMKNILLFASLLTLCVLFLSTRNAPSVSNRSAYLSAFILIGIAYSMYQTGIIQRLTFMVGHPLLATALVLPAMLAGTALGAYLSNTFFANKPSSKRIIVAIPLLLAIYAFAFMEPADLIISSKSLEMRCLIAIILSGIPSIIMGSYFPVIFNRLEKSDNSALLWAWLSNGLGGLIGAILGILAAMLVGFKLSILSVFPLYAAASAWDSISSSKLELRIKNLSDVTLNIFLLGCLIYLLYISY
ncbi:MAG: hypothetical protein KDD56_05585 [Bdellovibrionales bacterium]|nr:hypothetical protein [Bdellovibrionales bacterium]